MMHATWTKSILILFLLICTQIRTSAQPNPKSQWFQDARYGMFIHWGLYSAAEGLWKGEKLRYLNNYAEWIRYRNRISKEEYGQLAERFDWEKINPEQWVLLAKEAGMKYIIMTSKHHDGVALWDTKIGNYSISKLGNTNRDILKELAEACRKHDMKLGFYYSHWIDWEHPYAWDHNQELKGRVTDAQFDQYWQQKVIPQLSELLTNYGDVALMWFDMWIPYQESIIKKEQLLQVVQLIRQLQPNCLINSRLGLPTDAANVDFETFGDNQFGTSYIDHPWETPATIAHSWGYNGQENQWKSTSQIFQNLISNVSLNGGLTLNIGPRADGTVPYESIQRLQDIGQWLTQNGNSIYGATGLPLHAKQHDWGYLTRKGKQVFAQVFNWPLDHTLRISGINNSPIQVYQMKGHEKRNLKFTQNGPLLHIDLQGQEQDHYVSTIIIDYESPISIDKDVVAESSFGGFSLTPYNNLNKEIRIEKYNGKQPSRSSISTSTPLSWTVYIPEPGTYTFSISAHNPNKTNAQIQIAVDKQSLTSQLASDTQLVAEPNENNYTPEFTDRQMGVITFKEKGKHHIQLINKGTESIWFNWLWINK